MKKHLVITLTGHDRVGIVEHVTKLLLEYDSNVEASQMSRLGGEFAMLMLVAVPENKFENLREGIRHLKEEGYKIITRQTERGYSTKYVGWMPYQIKVSGADHEGIIHHITQYMAEQGINIETMETGMLQAPMSGTPLFTMTAVVLVPPDLLSNQEWREELESVGDSVNVDIEVLSYTG